MGVGQPRSGRGLSLRIDAKRKDNKYPCRDLAGVGVVFKLIQAIGRKLELEQKEYLKYLDIVCVGTISDIVPLVDENRLIAKLGLMLITQTKNMGLRSLLISSGYKNIDSNTISFGVAPRINACGRMGHAEEALNLLLSKDVYEVNELTEYAKENNIKINFIKIDSLEKAKNAPCVFNNWANFYKGEFISNTILNANSFEKLLK